LTRAKEPKVLAETADVGGPDADMATLARGGRLNVFGFALRLAGMVPFLFIGGRIYGPAALGRFAYAVLAVEFAAQLAALGLRRGLAQLLANAEKPQSCVVADAMLVAAIGSVIGMALLLLFPVAMYPTTAIQGTAADLIKRAMTRMGPALLAAGIDRTRMLLQVHDELVFEVPDDEVERASTVIRQVMEDAAAPALTLSVPLAVEIGQGASWGAAH
jgi:hypothetical protein